MYKCRKAKVSDCDALARIEYRSMPYEIREEPMDLDVFGFYDMWYSRIINHEFEVIILSDGDNDCAFIAYKVNQQSCLIQALYVDPKYFRHGYGTALIKTLERQLNKLNIHTLYLYVQRNNKVAIDFYQALNFKKGPMHTPYLMTMIRELD